MSPYSQTIVAATLESAKVRPLAVGLEQTVFELAAKIERLIAEHNAQTSALVNEWFIAGQQFRKEIARLTAEVAALRSTLHQPVEWLRNNYQDHANIASLCDAMQATIDAARKEQP